MAYQSKNHRKFLATSLTAAMVATAVAPAASFAASFPDVQDNNFYAPYVNQLADAGIIEGMPNGEFGLREKVTRAQAAKMVSLIRDLDLNAAAASFEDVKQDAWYAKYINALYAEKLVDGVTETEFAPNGTLTRAQFAKLVVDAYGLELQADAKTPFTDVKEGVWYTDYIKTLYANDLINGKTPTTFEPNATIDRADFAKLLVDADLEFGFTLGKAAVTGVSATNPTTLSLTGTGLKNLKAEDIKVEGNTVASVTSTDGKSATVSLGNKLGLDKEYKVTVGSGDDAKEFTVKYTFDITSVEVATTQVDDDADGQTIKFNVNGAAADLDFLVNVAGYQVEYQASSAEFLTGTTSTTGELDETAFAINDKFKVKVVLTKGGEVFSSDWKEVSVKNLNETPAIGSIVVENHRTTTATTDDFEMNSSTLVAGETATITEILSTSGDVINVTGGEVYTSSNKGVATVSSAGVISAIAPGKVDITVTSGLQSYTKTFTVTGTARTANTVAPAKASYTISKPTSTAGGYTVSVTAKDQYGDPVAATISSSSKIGTIADVTSSAVDGKATITLPAQSATGTYPVYLKVDGVQYGAFNVVVTNDTAIASTKIESSDNSLDLGGDKDTVVKVNQYTTAGGFIESLVADNEAGTGTTSGTKIDLNNGTTDYTLEVVDTSVATLAAVGSDITVTGTATGKTKLVLKEAGVDVAYFDVTVTDSTVSVSSITWKNPGTLETAGKDVTPRDVLTITNVSGDDIVTGLTLSKNTTSKVRIDEFTTSGSTAENRVYLDVNDSGDYESAEDVVLGTLAVTVDPQFSALTSAPTVVAAGTSADVWFDTTTDYGVLSRALAVGDKGELIFTFTKAGASVPLSSTVVNVDVK